MDRLMKIIIIIKLVTTKYVTVYIYFSLIRFSFAEMCRAKS